MRFTSLVVELIRARPRLVVLLVVLLQAALWLILPMLLYRSPPGDVATALAFGREYQVGTSLGPPLAFWLADIAFRAAGNTMFGVYLLAQASAVLTGYTSAFSGDDHHFGRLIVELSTEIVNRTDVVVTATYGLRDFSGSWDDRYEGEIRFCLIVDHGSPVVGPGIAHATD